ncbi:hypothetical protein [Chitinolyticbacter albus]|uniref:hypothetical protein n=1 Tax=Chitinolyticbacter albus TaxID=2961951 RepID=UPI002109402D|nr:hypothetical protein [Chitinolyticbacter albus]
MKVRQIGLVFALIVSSALTWWAGHAEEVVPAQAIIRHASLTSPTPLPMQKQSQLLRQDRREPAGGENPFQVAAWRKETTPAPSAAAVPASPSAPVLPFKLLGRYVDDERESFFLQYGERNVVASIGDVIDDTYKLVSLEGGVLKFNYLPLDIQQTLVVGEQN